METSPAPLAAASIGVSIGKRGAVLWRVEMQVQGIAAGVWLPQWEGFAFDSIDACSRARRDFYGQLHGEAEMRKRYPLRILSAVPVAI